MLRLKSFIIITFGFFALALSEEKINNKENSENPCNSNEYNEEQESGYINEALNDLDQEDPELIEAIRRMIVKPSDPDVPYNLTNNDERRFWGEHNQVQYLDVLFGNKKNGFFIEAGAFDGELYSNTLYLEMKKSWSGILVEPNPDAFSSLKTKQRKSNLFGHCLSTKRTPEVVEFDACGLIGGIIHNGQKPTDEEMYKPYQNYMVQVNQRTVKAQCFPLYSILMAMGNPKVDLFSLDIEGAEMPVLENIPWKKVNIGVILIEVIHLDKLFKGSQQEMRKFLEKKGYKHFRDVGFDQIYVKKNSLKSKKN